MSDPSQPLLQQSGCAQDVLDYIEWMWHVQWVHETCDSTTTALAAFEIFKRTSSADRGRALA